MELMDKILDSLIALHKWREGLSGSHIGFGYDQYKPIDCYHYPEAYALWGSGYLKLFKFTKSTKFLDMAIQCADWLIKNRNPNYENYSWGLPWAWTEMKAPKSLSYLITTTQVGDFFLMLYELTELGKYREVLLSIASWIENENSVEVNKEGIYFHYANHPSFKYHIYNPSAKGGAFFALLYTLTNDEKHMNLAIDSSKFIINKQNKDGSWYYSNRSNNIDNLHTGYILEALLDVYDATSKCSLDIHNSLRMGLEYYWKNLYYEDGRGREFIKKPKYDERAIIKVMKIWEVLLNIGFFFYPSIVEPRAGGYGAGIKTFSKASQIMGTENYSEKIANYIIDNLQRGDGAFKFKTVKEDAYIRHEAHVFDGLATLLLSLKGK